MDNAVLVGAVTNLTGLGVFDRSLNVRSHSTHLRVRHQATGAENLAKLTNDTHGVRSGDNHVEVHVALFNFVRQIVHTDNVCTGSCRFLGIGALGKDGHPDSLTGAVWQNSAATNHLIGFTCINAQVYSHV